MAWTKKGRLLEASSNGDVETLRDLLPMGVDPCCTDKDGWTALHKAACGGHDVFMYEIYRFKLQAAGRSLPQPDPGEALRVPKQKEARAAVVKCLLSYGARVDARTPKGITPLMLAAETRFIDAVRALLEAGADRNATDRDGTTPIDYAVRSNCTPVLSALLEGEAPIDVRGDAGVPLLLQAVMFNAEDSARLLLSKGVNINFKLRDGRTLADFARHEATKPGMRDLLLAAAKEQVQFPASTARPLQGESQKGAPQFDPVVRQLVEQQRNIIEECISFMSQSQTRSEILGSFDRATRLLKQTMPNLAEAAERVRLLSAGLPDGYVFRLKEDFVSQCRTFLMSTENGLAGNG